MAPGGCAFTAATVDRVLDAVRRGLVVDACVGQAVDAVAESLAGAERQIERAGGALKPGAKRRRYQQAVAILNRAERRLTRRGAGKLSAACVDTLSASIAEARTLTLCVRAAIDRGS